MNRVTSYAIVHAPAGGVRADVLRTWRECFPGTPPERFDWIYRRNPAGGAYVWTAREVEQQRVVGVTAVFPRRVAVGAAFHTVGIAGDYAVSAAHRGFGPALALQRRAVAATDGRLDLVYGLPNTLSAPLLRRAGYRSIGHVVQLTCVLRSRPLLERYGPNRLLAGIVAPLIDVGLRARATGGPSLRTGRPDRFEAEDVATFDGRFDRLWSLAQPLHPMIGDRSAVFLRWRFTESPHARYRTFGLVDARDGELAGYVVYRRIDGRTVVDDLLCRDLEDTLDTLIRRFVLHQLDDGATAISVSFFGRAALIGALRRQRFAVRAARDPVMVYAGDASPLRDVARSPDNWWLFPADNDV